MKRAVITGGAGLIGTGISKDLIAAGWDVISLDLKPEGPEGARAIVCDISDETAVARAFDEMGDDPLDLLVNNGGIAEAHGAPLAELSLGAWRSIVDSHLTGAFLVTRAAIPRLRDGASIVNIASTRAFMSDPDSEAYAAAKGGMVALTHALAVSLGPKVRVNAIAPGWISASSRLLDADHQQHPVGRVGRPDDIAGTVRYLAEAGFVTGQVLTVDGGMTRKMIYED